MPTPQNDDTQVDDSSSSTDTEVESSDQDAEGASSNATATKQPQSLADVVKATFAKSQSAGDKEADKEEPETESEEDEESEPEEEVVEPDKETTEDEESTESEEGDDKEGSDKTEDDKKGPVPYTRFSQVISEKNELQAKLTETEPAVKAYDSIASFLSQSNVPPERFHFWLDVAAAAENDPQEAMRLLEPYLKEYQAARGEVLAPDLQAAVDSEEMSLDWARKVMAMRSETKFKQHQAKAAQKQTAAQREQQVRAEMTSALSAWDKSKRGSDPDFKPRVGLNAPEGKYEVFHDKFKSAVNEAKSIEDVLSIAERCYAAADKLFKSFVSKPKLGKTVRASTTTTTPPAKPKTLSEVVQAVARKHGVKV